MVAVSAAAVAQLTPLTVAMSCALSALLSTFVLWFGGGRIFGRVFAIRGIGRFSAVSVVS
jgi:hypothetical protein